MVTQVRPAPDLLDRFTTADRSAVALVANARRRTRREPSRRRRDPYCTSGTAGPA